MQDRATAADRANIHPMTRATAPIHTCTLHPGPVAGVHAVQMHSARAFGKHWHDSFGFGLMDEGGQEIVCHWCGEHYHITPDEIADLDAQHTHAQA